MILVSHGAGRTGGLATKCRSPPSAAAAGAAQPSVQLADDHRESALASLLAGSRTPASGSSDSDLASCELAATRALIGIHAAQRTLMVGGRRLRSAWLLCFPLPTRGSPATPAHVVSPSSAPKSRGRPAIRPALLSDISEARSGNSLPTVRWMPAGRTARVRRRLESISGPQSYEPHKHHRP